MKSRLLRLSWRISIWDNNRKVQLCGKISITTKCLNGRKKSKINEFSNWKKKDNETVILIFRLSYLYILQIYLLLDFVAQTLCVLKENKISSQWIPKIRMCFDDFFKNTPSGFFDTKDDFEDVTTCTECAELNIPISCKPNLTSLMQIITIEHYDFHLTFS